MQALTLRKIGEPIHYGQMSDPVAGDGQVVVDVVAAALNHRDVWITKGMYPGIREGVVLGSDGAGYLDGKPVIINPNHDWGSNPRVQGRGYHILGLPNDGTFAEKVVVGTDKVRPMPSHLSFEQAAALPLGGMTAYRALFTKCGLRKGERVLISGVGGGVALFAFQFAVAAGAEVWVTSGSEEKIARATDMGAAGGINYKTGDWKAFGKRTGGFDVVIDSAAGDGFAQLVKLCRPAARICFYGGTRGKINNLNPQLIFWKQISIHGSTMGTDGEFAEMVDFVEEHEIVPVVDSVFPLAQGAAAFQRMDEGAQFGKIVLGVG